MFKRIFSSSLPLYLLLLGVVCMPWVFSTHTLDAGLAPRFTFLGGLLVLLSLLQWLRPVKGVVSLRYLWPFLAFLAFEGLSLCNAHTPSEGIVVLLRDAGLLVFLVSIVQLIKSEQGTVLLSRAWLLANLSIVGYGVYQLYGLGFFAPKEELYEVVSLLSHRNLFATAMVLSLPFVVFNVWCGRGIWRWIALLLLLTNGLLIFLLASRNAWLAYIVFGMSYPLWLLGERVLRSVHTRFWRRVFIALSISGLVAFSAVYFFDTPIPQKGAELTSGLGINGDDAGNFTIQERIMLWKGSMRMVWDNGYGGVGAGNWKIMFPAYGSDIWRARQGMVQFQRPHNDYLWVLAETGIWGLWAYLSGFVLLLFGGLKASSDPALNKHTRIFIRLLLSGVLTYLVVAFFSFPRERIFHQLLLYSMLGLLLMFSRPQWNEKPLLKWSYGIAALLVAGGMLWVGTVWWKGEQVARKLNEARVYGDWHRLEREYKKVEGSWCVIDAVSIPLSFYSGLAALNLQEYQKSEEAFRKAYRLHPNNIHVLNNVANIYYLQGETDSATVYYKKALKVSPKYLDGALNLMAIYFNTNQIEEAYSVLRSYEAVFEVERPDHLGLATYREAIMKSKQALLLEEQQHEMHRAYLQELTAEQFLQLYVESLEANVSLQTMLDRKVGN